MPMCASSAAQSGQRGSSAAKAYAASLTLRVSTPTVSSVELSGTAPATDQRPTLVFSPTFPVMLAGTRTEPAVSVPSAISADPSARLTPAPLLEPPGTRCASASQGLRGVGQWLLTPRPPKASSTMCVLPVMTARSRRSRVTIGPSVFHFAGSARGVPANVSRPCTPNRSLTDTGMPCKGPRSAPLAKAASAAAAQRSASSASWQRYASSSGPRRR